MCGGGGEVRNKNNFLIFLFHVVSYLVLNLFLIRHILQKSFFMDFC